MAQLEKLSESVQQNSAKVLEFIYRKGSTSRIEIATELGLKPAAVTNLVNILLENQKIFETGHETRELEGAGRSRKLLSVYGDYAFVIGLEFNVRRMSVVATNIQGTILYQEHLKMTDDMTENINTAIISLINHCLEAVSHKKCAGIGIAIPGHYDFTGDTIISNNTSWRFFNLNKIKKEYPFPVFVENNIECMALSEYLFDAQASPEKFLFLHIGPGIFCSFFNGKYISNKENFYIGELGHTVVDLHGSYCECGKRGCLQTYISDTWLIESAKYLFKTSANTVLKSIVNTADDINLDTVINAYHLGDSYIIDKIEAGLLFLATSIANSLIIYDSQKIYINNELINRLPLKKKLIQHIKEQLKFIPGNDTLDICLLSFDDYRGALGGCSLVTYRNVIHTN